jgi:hypothetical protein
MMNADCARKEITGAAQSALEVSVLGKIDL